MKALVVLATAALLAAGCGGSDDGNDRAGAVQDLQSVESLRTAFARADGSPRLLLLLSPT